MATQTGLMCSHMTAARRHTYDMFTCVLPVPSQHAGLHIIHMHPCNNSSLKSYGSLAPWPLAWLRGRTGDKAVAVESIELCGRTRELAAEARVLRGGGEHVAVRVPQVALLQRGRALLDVGDGHADRRHGFGVHPANHTCNA